MSVTQSGRAMGAEVSITDESLPDIALIRKYDVAGPRYTSYPTALQFGETFTADDYRDAAADSNALPIPRPLSLYIHIPFCATLCFYCACNKIVTRRTELADAYLGRLFREVDLHGEIFAPDRPVVQLHLGGGTPTYLKIAQIESLLARIGERFHLSQDHGRDFSIEIDPRTVDAQVIWRLRAAGFNRLSLGVQDFDPDVQRAVHRIQGEEVTLAAMAAARDAGFHSINVDLIYGLPKQTPASFARTLDKVLSSSPDRLSIFNYAHLPERFAPQRRIQADDLPTPEQKLRILADNASRLASAGYVHIGMDHFARSDDELTRAKDKHHLYRNFQGYASHADCDLVGIGVSAISKVDRCYSQNLKALEPYQERIDSGELAVDRGIRLSREDYLRREIINSLMCYDEIDMPAVEEEFGVDFRRHFRREMSVLDTMQRDGLLHVGEQRVTLTATGRYLVRNVAMVFDEYLAAEAGGPARYSRVI